MACGLPVVPRRNRASPISWPNGEEAGGVVVPREDEVALAAALQRLLEDPALARRLGSQARRRAQEEFSLAVVGLRLRDFVFPTVFRDLP